MSTQSIVVCEVLDRRGRETQIEAKNIPMNPPIQSTILHNNNNEHSFTHSVTSTLS
jgi:hypothetical protein